MSPAFFGSNSDFVKFLSPVFTKLSGRDEEGGEWPKGGPQDGGDATFEGEHSFLADCQQFLNVC